MVSSPRPLPAALAPSGFTFAAARAHGESSGSLRRRDLHHVTHGVHADTPPVGHEHLRALLLAMPQPSAFSHVTAGGLHGFPDVGRPRDDDLVHLMRPTGSAQVRRPQVHGHRGLESRVVIEQAGLPVVDAADTWCDFGELIRSERLTVDDLVVLGDAAANVVLAPGRTAYDVGDRRPEWWTDESLQERLDVRRRQGHLVRTELAARLADRNRPRGKSLLSLALPLIRPGVRSPMETRARLALAQGGLPEPWVNLDIYSEAGQWLAEGDLVWPGPKVVGEYQGAHHAERAQASKDSARRQLLEDHQWRVLEIWAEDLSDWTRRLAMLNRFARHIHPLLRPPDPPVE